MWTFIAWSLLIVGLFALPYYNCSPKIWIPVFAIILLVVTPALPLGLTGILWAMWLGLTGIMLFSPWRVYFISRLFLRWFRKQQPPLSQSEIETVQAGGTWWEAQFFTGSPDWKQLLSLEQPKLTEEEQAFLDNQVETLCHMLDDWKIQQDHDMPESVWDYIKKEGFWGLIIEKEYGGHAFSAIAHSTIVSKIASRSVSAAISIMVPNSLGPGEFLTHYGTPEQKQRYLPRLVKGKDVGCFALTATEAGSDATSIVDKGIVCKGEYQGKEVMGIRLNWDKRYITLAPITTLIALAFKLYDPDRLLGDKENIGMTVALIPADLPGVEIGSRHLPLNLAFLNGPLRGKDVFIPLEFIPGGVESCGQGWKMMMECLSLGRGISLPSLATAVSKLCFRTSGAYAQIRQQFKRPIGQFEGVADALAHIGGYTYLCEATRLFTAFAVDKGARPAIASAITKYHLTEISRRVINHAMDIHAGRGIQMGPRNYLGLLYQAIPISITVEGANILTRNLIIYGQGIMRCHPFLHKELEIASAPDSKEQTKKFDKLLLSHVGFVWSQLARAIIYGLTGGKLIATPGRTRVAKYFRQMTRMSNALILVTDITLLVMGSKIKLKEFLSARLGDVLSYLYMASAVAKLYVAQGRHASDWPFAEWALDYCFSKIQTSFDGFFANFPVRFVAKCMRWIIFPWGRAYQPPRDTTAAEIAAHMQQNTEVRDRLTRYCYIGAVDSAVGRVEKAFQDMEKVRPLLHKLQTAHKANQGTLNARIEAAFQAGVFSTEERDQLQQFAVLYWDALQVDEFDFKDAARHSVARENETEGETI